MDACKGLKSAKIIPLFIVFSMIHIQQESEQLLWLHDIFNYVHEEFNVNNTTAQK